jgi:hypothetical protein
MRLGHARPRGANLRAGWVGLCGAPVPAWVVEGEVNAYANEALNWGKDKGRRNWILGCRISGAQAKRTGEKRTWPERCLCGPPVLSCETRQGLRRLITGLGSKMRNWGNQYCLLITANIFCHIT